MKNSRHKATVLLLLVSVSFFISYPFHHNFFGGLLSGIFGAAMIGGLADWFAVAALFRRPLGIPFRTAIIPRNRERIFQALAVMVEEEILMKETIRERLAQYDVVGLLVPLIISDQGKDTLKRVLYQLLKEGLADVQEGQLRVFLRKVLGNAIKQVELAPYVINGSRWLVERNYHGKIVDVLLDWLLVLLAKPKMQGWLDDWFSAAIRQYEAGKGQRVLFNTLAELSPREIAGLVQQKTLLFLGQLKEAGDPLRNQVLAWLESWAEYRLQEEAVLAQIHLWQIQLARQPILAEWLAPALEEFCHQAASDNRQTLRQLERLLQGLEEYVLALQQDEGAKERLNETVKKILGDWLDIHHREIGSMVLASLDRFSNERLVDFMETKVGNDLQMIRINGSVVGGLAGGLLYLATFWL